MRPGALDFDAGLFADREMVGAQASVKHRFNEHLWGFAEGRGYRTWEGRWGGEAFLGIGGEF